ncbi:hypothetical protein VTN96DRAFT_8653 [Rasamsonia emersonii]
MIHFLYGIDYDDSGSSSNSSSSEDSSQSSPLFNVKVYGIADKYGIETLQLRAQEKFAAAIRTGWKQDEFAHAIVEAYTKTSAATDKKSILRKVIVEVAKEHIESLMEMDEFVNALEDVGGFGADLIHALVGGTTVRECHRCRFRFRTVFTRELKCFCPACRKFIPHEEGTCKR